LNPNGTDAMFTNTGPWVRVYDQGASVVSTVPQFQGGWQPIARTEAYQRVRETIDPDDYTGRFALWSGTSFAAPLFAGRLAAKLLPDLPAPDSVCKPDVAVATAWATVSALTGITP
jgi:hypothetical protein